MISARISIPRCNHTPFVYPFCLLSMKIPTFPPAPDKAEFLQRWTPGASYLQTSASSNRVLWYNPQKVINIMMEKRFWVSSVSKKKRNNIYNYKFTCTYCRVLRQIISRAHGFGLLCCMHQHYQQSSIYVNIWFPSSHIAVYLFHSCSTFLLYVL